MADTKPSPATLYNTKTRQPETVSEGDLDSLVKSGAYTYKAGTKVNVLDDQNQSYSIDSTELPTALGQGFKIETPTQQAVREYVKDNEGLKGTAKVFLKQFANQAAFGVPGIIEDHTDDDFERAKSEALKKDHQIANIAGGVTGFGASIPLGAPLFRGATAAGQAAERVIASGLENVGLKAGADSAAKSIVNKIVSKSANLGTQGAIISAPAAITEASLGDPESAAESLLLGAGFGVGLGGLGHIVGAGASKLANKINLDKVVNFVDEVGKESAIRSIGFKKSDIARFSQQGSEYGGNRLNEIADDLMKQKIIKAGDSLDTIANKIELKKSEVGQSVNDTLNQLDTRLAVDPSLQQHAFIPSQAANIIKEKLIDPIAMYPNRSGELKAAQDVVDSLKNLGDNPIPFSDAVSTRNNIFGKENLTANFKKLDPTEKDIIDRRAYGIITDSIEKSAQNVFNAIGDTQGLSQYIKNKNMLRNFIDLERATSSKQASELANRRISLTDFIIGGSGLATTLASDDKSSGVPLLMALMSKKLLEKYGNAAGADYFNKFTNFIKTNINTKNSGLLSVEQANKAVGTKLDSVKDFFNPTKAVTKAQGATTALNRFIGNDDKKLSNAEKVEKFNTVLSQYSGNPTGLSDTMSDASTPYADLGAPNVANAYQSKIMTTLDYLNSIVPKPTTAPNPFLKQQFQPSTSDISKFERKLEVVNDPFVVIEKLKDGTLTSDEVEALKTVYPKIHQGIVDRLTQQAMDPKTPPVSYQQRVKLSLLFDTSLDPSLEQQSIAGFQASYGNQPQSQPAQPAPANKPLKIGQGQALEDIPQHYETDMQRLANPS